MINQASAKSVEAMLDDLELQIACARIEFESWVDSVVKQTAIELGYALAKHLNEMEYEP